MLSVCRPLPMARRDTRSVGSDSVRAFKGAEIPGRRPYSSRAFDLKAASSASLRSVNTPIWLVR